MPVVLFAVLDVIGTIARLLLVRTLADIFVGPLASVTRVLGRYEWWLVAVSIVIGIAQLLRRRHTTRSRSPDTPH